MIPVFLKISLLEGLSWLLLLFIAMPLKYYWAMPEAVSLVGPIHGALFVIYLLSSLIVSHQSKWSLAFYLWALLCAFLPFGFLLLNKQLKSQKIPAMSNAQ